MNEKLVKMVTCRGWRKNGVDWAYERVAEGSTNVCHYNLDHGLLLGQEASLSITSSSNHHKISTK